MDMNAEKQGQILASSTRVNSTTHHCIVTLHLLCAVRRAVIVTDLLHASVWACVCGTGRQPEGKGSLPRCRCRCRQARSSSASGEARSLESSCSQVWVHSGLCCDKEGGCVGVGMGLNQTSVDECSCICAKLCMRSCRTSVCPHDLSGLSVKPPADILWGTCAQIGAFADSAQSL